jgi:predicted dithiol-disulfide oxidoreductase (DUF899 family)
MQHTVVSQNEWLAARTALLARENFLDFAPKGRDEDGLPWSMAWVRRHDEYEGAAQSCGGGHH